MRFLNTEDAAYYRVKKVKGHKCSLNYEEDTVSNYVKSGAFVPLRRFFRRSIIISSSDPRTKGYAKSISSIIIEQKHHLERHYYMIHPFSDFHFFWQTLITINHLFILIVTPIYYLDKTSKKRLHEDRLKYVIKLTCIGLFFVDILLNFCIGFYDKNKDKVVLQPKRVIIRYLTTYFLFDVMATVNYNFIGKVSKLYAQNWYSRLQWAFKLIRLISINNYFDNVQMRLDWPNYLYRGLKYAIFTTVILLWMNIFGYAIDYHFERKINFNHIFDKYFTMLSHILETIFLCDILDKYSQYIEHLDLILGVVLLHLGKFFEIWLLAQFIQIFASYMVINQKHATMLHQVEAFTRFKDLPKRMCRRIYSYLNFRFQCLIFNENALIDNLCFNLKDEILWHKCQYLVTKVHTFKELPSPIMLKLATMLKPEIYLPNDVVIHCGEVGREMFFVYVGVLAVFTESGKEICHLSDGAHFGEIALLLNEPRVASVVAIDFCELYRLTKNDFQEAIDPYPLVKSNIMQAAKDRYKETRTFAQAKT